jgi:large subunit ribosomal protein L3
MIAIIGKKAGMTQVFDENGILQPVCVIKADSSVVVGERTEARDGYQAVIVGAGIKKGRGLTKPYAGQFKGGLTPTQRLVEFRDFDGEYQVGGALSVAMFEGHAVVDVRGESKGKGFQGVIRRHGFAGGSQTHGSKFHRQLGSSGMAATPSRTLKGVRMAGRMGGERVTVQNIRVIAVNPEQGLILLGGPVPGARNAYVVVISAKKGKGAA